jgi:CheY-like chemotaxis protein
MAYAFDAPALGRLVDEVETLLAHARVQEEGLAKVTSVFADIEVASPEMGGDVRRLCVAAREQRQRLQGLLRSLIGSPPQSNELRPLVLVVNDAADDRDLTAEILEGADVDVITATNGLEAIVVASYARPALVLMDVNMPLLDGIEAARLLKAHPATHRLKLVAHTAWPQYYGGPLKRLFDAVLAKPIAPDALVAAVERFLAGGDAIPAASAAR